MTKKHSRKRVRPRGRAVFPRLELPRLDGQPSRPYTSVNARFEEKRAFDLLHSWWRLSRGESLEQIDAFSRVLALAVDHPDADAPEPLRRALRRGVGEEGAVEEEGSSAGA